MKKIVTIFLVFLLVFTVACEKKDEAEVKDEEIQEEMKLEDYLNIERTLKHPVIQFGSHNIDFFQENNLYDFVDLNIIVYEDPDSEKFKDIIREIFDMDYIMEDDWESYFSTSISNGVFRFEYDRLTGEESFFAARIYLDQEKRDIGNTCYGIEIPWEDPLMDKIREYVGTQIEKSSEGQINLEEFENLVY